MCSFLAANQPAPHIPTTSERALFPLLLYDSTCAAFFLNAWWATFYVSCGTCHLGTLSWGRQTPKSKFQGPCRHTSATVLLGPAMVVKLFNSTGERIPPRHPLTLDQLIIYTSEAAVARLILNLTFVNFFLRPRGPDLTNHVRRAAGAFSNVSLLKLKSAPAVEGRVPKSGTSVMSTANSAQD